MVEALNRPLGNLSPQMVVDPEVYILMEKGGPIDLKIDRSMADIKK